MSTVGNHSSTIIITIQTKNPTFTPEIFDKTIKDLGFMASQANANISANPLARPVPTVIYSKGNMMVAINYAEYLVRFVIINTLDLNTFQSTINEVLEKLQVAPASIHIADLQCKTEIPTPDSPINTLTSLFDKDSLQKISKIFKVPGMDVLGISLGNSNWQEGEFRINVEPLASDPANQFWVVIAYRTKSLFDFHKLIQEFNSKMVEDILTTIRKV